ncbi:MAG: YigZ family protein [Clostridium sp.]|nr:YigZ family protein [Clostridium sp.]
MNFYTIKDEAVFEFEEKKSVFIGSIKRVETENEAKEFIEQVKSTHKDAKHNVFAYIIGENKEIQRCSDNGEPQGTAGVPVLEVIKKNNLTNVIIVVTRIFGGILLGTGGLVRAYTKAAAESVKKGNIVLKVLGIPIYVTANYDLLGKLQYTFEQKKWHVENIEYTDKVKIEIRFAKEDIESAEKMILDTCSGNCSFIKGEERYYFKIDNRFYI